MAKVISLIIKYKYLIIILIITSFLRLWRLDKVPVSLFSDELDVGYQAYSIIKTGKDYMGNPLPLYFHSYADFRAPIYIYSTVPTVFLFGITPYGIRLPAAIFGILGIWAIYVLANQLFEQNKLSIFSLRVSFGDLSALFLSLSPWHLQYSRASFEATELLVFLLFGLFFFFKSIHSRQPKCLLISAFFLGLTPWTYSTAKLFTPILILFLVTFWKREVFEFSKKTLFLFILILAFFFAPLVLTGAGSQRFSYISIFTDPTIDGEVASQRLIDAQVEGGMKRNILEKVGSRVIHNKYGLLLSKIVNSYFETFSSQFLFIKGDLNLRHSPEGIGQFYKIEALALFLGATLFFVFFKDKKIKQFLAFWILFGAFPSALTRDGGHHATRLILILPPLVFLISYGIVEGLQKIHLGGAYIATFELFKRLAVFFYIFIWVVSFGLYLHTYYVHNPWYSERNWHAGYKELVDSAKKLQKKYNKIIISNANDDPRIFLAAYYPYSPEVWQKGFQKAQVSGFGELQHIDKFYFGQVGEEGIEILAEILDVDTLYIAAQRELGTNLVLEPQKVPQGLHLVETITYPSGEPAYYLLEKAKI